MISQLSAKYQFCTIHTADTTDGKVTTRAPLSIESEKVGQCGTYIITQVKIPSNRE